VKHETVANETLYGVAVKSTSPISTVLEASSQMRLLRFFIPDLSQFIDFWVMQRRFFSCMASRGKIMNNKLERMR
jgi:hypothetical protein